MEIGILLTLCMYMYITIYMYIYTYAMLSFLYYQWLLLEDIDIAPMDVITSLLPLIETGTLPSTNEGHNSKAKPGFQLFMTKRLHSAGENYGYPQAEKKVQFVCYWM